MEAQPDGGADTALGEALRLDPTLAAEPARLRRALADLAPHDERGWLLALGAATAVPALIGQGQAAEARAHLTDACGCRPDAARWAVSAWALALGQGTGQDEDLPAGPRDGASPGFGIRPGPQAAADEPPDEEPGPPTALRVGVWPDGTPSAAVVTMRGVFALADLRAQARGQWRRAATVQAPLSRDVSLVLDGHRAEVVWTDHDGVHARSLRRAAAGRLSLGGPRLLAAPPEGEQARYPLAALGYEADTLSVAWTAGRRALVLTEERGLLPAGNPVLLPAATAAGERLAGLDVCTETERTAWLACRTDRGRVLAARWDLSASEVSSWRPLDLPADLLATAVVGLDGIPVLVAVAAGGALLSLDLRAADGGRAAWHSIDRPDRVRAVAPARMIAAGAPVSPPGAPGHTGWLVLAGPAGILAMPVTRHGDIIGCGDPVDVWTGP